MSAKWPPDLETAIRDYAAFEERSWARQNAPVPESLSATWDALEAETRDKKQNGLPNLAIIARATGLPAEFSADNMQKIVDFAHANGSDAADKLKDIIPQARLYEAEAVSWSAAAKSGPFASATPASRKIAN